jgi:hypothetical protein
MRSFCVCFLGLSAGCGAESRPDGNVAPTTWEARIANGTDDIEQDDGVQVSSPELELVEGDGESQLVGLRFPSAPVPSGAAVTHAWVQFTVREETTDSASLVVRAEYADDALAFGELATRSLTLASATWPAAPWSTPGEAGADQRTPDLSAVLQEVVDRPGWNPGNALVVVVSGSGTRTAESFEGNAGTAPLLHVEYR